MRKSTTGTRIGSIVLLLVLFGFSFNGFMSLVAGDRWTPKHPDGSNLRCQSSWVEKGNEVRHVPAECDNGKFYMISPGGGTNFKEEISEQEAKIYAELAHKMGEDWRPGMPLDSPRVQEALAKINPEVLAELNASQEN